MHITMSMCMGLIPVDAFALMKVYSMEAKVVLLLRRCKQGLGMVCQL